MGGSKAVYAIAIVWPCAIDVESYEAAGQKVGVPRWWRW
jgi:hypothetical protein